jgi:type III pantothenate kinase
LRQHLALVASVRADYPEYQLLVTGGDGQTLAASLNTGYYPDLIFDGMDSLCVGLYTA